MIDIDVEVERASVYDRVIGIAIEEVNEYEREREREGGFNTVFI